MFKTFQDKKPTVENSNRISASIVVRNKFINNPNLGVPIITPQYDLRNEEDIKKLISWIEMSTTFNLKQENFGEVELSEPNKVRLSYTKSNLGKGFVFWFICNNCNRKCRFLHMPSNNPVLACRKCHKLNYESQTNNDSKLIRKYMSDKVF